MTAIAAQTEVMTYREALRLALREELTRDERVFVMGEEVGVFDGAYKVTSGLLNEFGPDRVRDTPISEEGFVGAGVGAAMLGERPVVEIMTLNFLLARWTRSSTTPRRSARCSAARCAAHWSSALPTAPATSSPPSIARASRGGSRVRPA